MGRAQSDTYNSLFNKSDNVNLDKTFDRKSVFVHVLIYTQLPMVIDWLVKRVTHLHFHWPQISTYTCTRLSYPQLYDTDTDTNISLF